MSKKTCASIPASPMPIADGKKSPKRPPMPIGKWIWRHENVLRRAFAGYAISQHPFHRPPKLFEAIETFIVTMRLEHRHSSGVLRLHTTTFRRRVYDFCHSCRVVVAWNRPKKGKHTMAFVTRYGGPRPEYDFIDLGALSGNVVREVLKQDD